MSNHIHTIWTGTNKNLSDVVRDFKTYSSKAISASVENEPESRREWLLYMFNFFANRTQANDIYKVWTNNNHPEEIYNGPFLKVKMDYLHQNPVRAGLVARAEDFMYSSAENYTGKKGLMDIDMLIF